MSERLWDIVWSEPLRGALPKLGIVLLNTAGALALLVIGLIIGGIARALVVRLLRAVGFAARCERWGIAQAVLRAGITRPPERLAGAIVFWGIFLIFAMLGIDTLLALPGAAGATSLLVRVVPNLLAALLVLVVGWLMANFLAQAVLIGAVNSQIPEARLLSRAVRWAVIFFTLGIVLTQLGIGKEMVLLAFALTFGGLILTLSLAFGLGGRDVARELLERRMRRERAPEDEIAHL